MLLVSVRTVVVVAVVGGGGGVLVYKFELAVFMRVLVLVVGLGSNLPYTCLQLIALAVRCTGTVQYQRLRPKNEKHDNLVQEKRIRVKICDIRVRENGFVGQHYLQYEYVSSSGDTVRIPKRPAAERYSTLDMLPYVNGRHLPLLQYSRSREREEYHQSFVQYCTVLPAALLLSLIVYLNLSDLSRTSPLFQRF